MSLKSLGMVDPLFITSQDGWDEPQSAQLVRVLSDGTSEQNEVLQQGAWPLRQQAIAGIVYDRSDMVTLRGYNHTKQAVEFRDPDDETLMVRVYDFAGSMAGGAPWTFHAILIEAGDVPGS